MTPRLRLLIIDPQVDFCDGPAGGALPVAGAWEDMVRLAHMIDRLGTRIDAIDVTLDSHHALDIAHAAWWMDAAGASPPPFTMMTPDDVATGRWAARNLAWQARSLDYVRQLEANGKYVLLIWPTHCLIGSPGHAIQPDLLAALRRWEERALSTVNFVAKGANPFTEHYSAITAEVPDPDDAATLPNAALLDRLRDGDLVLVGGEALSHCVKATVTDIADLIGPPHVARFVLLTDCMSPVPAPPGGPDFPALGEEFLGEMAARGMTLARSAEVFR